MTEARTQTRPTLLRRFGRHLAGNVVAYLALVLALSGPATAAIIISSESQIATGAVGTRAILDRSVRSTDLAVAEPWRVVGAAGQPAFTTVSGCNGNAGYVCEYKNRAGSQTKFYKDPYGVVHVRLNVCYSYRLALTPAGSGECFGSIDVVDRKVFTLPTGYRPGNTLYFAARQFTLTNEVSAVTIGSGGSVLERGCTDCLVKSGIISQEFSFRAP